MSRPRISSNAGARRIIGALAALAAALMMMTNLATAQDRALDAPRAAGQVAERFDGFAMVRDSSAPASLRALVERINAQRREVYRNQAGQRGVPESAVGRIYAREIFNAAPAGTWFLQESGQWVRK